MEGKWIGNVSGEVFRKCNSGGTEWLITAATKMVFQTAQTMQKNVNGSNKSENQYSNKTSNKTSNRTTDKTSNKASNKSTNQASNKSDNKMKNRATDSADDCNY